MSDALTRLLPDAPRRHRGRSAGALREADALGMTEMALLQAPTHADLLRQWLNQALDAAGLNVFDRAKAFRAIDPEGSKGGDTEARRQALTAGLTQLRDTLKARAAACPPTN
jgi:hypothetical protein